MTSEAKAREVLAQHYEKAGATDWAHDCRSERPLMATEVPIKAMLAFAAEARSHDGEWEAMREHRLRGLDYTLALMREQRKHETPVNAAFVDEHIGALESLRAMVSDVPLFDEGRL